jgi:hypothetical protein
LLPRLLLTLRLQTQLLLLNRRKKRRIRMMTWSVSLSRVFAYLMLNFLQQGFGLFD